MLHLASLIFALLPFSFLFNSCHFDPLVGEWTYEATEYGHSTKLVYTFTKDTYMQNEFTDGVANRSSDGNYSREGGVIILRPRQSSKVIRGKLTGGKLILTLQEGGVYSDFRTYDITLTKK